MHSALPARVPNLGEDADAKGSDRNCAWGIVYADEEELEGCNGLLEEVCVGGEECGRGDRHCIGQRLGDDPADVALSQLLERRRLHRCTQALKVCPAHRYLAQRDSNRLSRNQKKLCV